MAKLAEEPRSSGGAEAAPGTRVLRGGRIVHTLSGAGAAAVRKERLAKQKALAEQAGGTALIIWYFKIFSHWIIIGISVVIFIALFALFSVA